MGKKKDNSENKKYYKLLRYIKAIINEIKLDETHDDFSAHKLRNDLFDLSKDIEKDLICKTKKALENPKTDDHVFGRKNASYRILKIARNLFNNLNKYNSLLFEKITKYFILIINIFKKIIRCSKEEHREITSKQKSLQKKDGNNYKWFEAYKDIDLDNYTYEDLKKIDKEFEQKIFIENMKIIIYSLL